MILTELYIKFLEKSEFDEFDDNYTQYWFFKCQLVKINYWGFFCIRISESLFNIREQNKCT